MRCLTKSIVAAVLSVASSNYSATASDRTLPGFRRFLFGMTESDVRRIAGMEAAADNKLLYQLSADHPIEIDAMSFRLSFRFTPAGLSQIELQNRTELTMDACRQQFEHFFELVRAWYGEPIAPPAHVAFSGMAAALNKASTMGSVSFAFRDGARVRVSSKHFEQICELSISYSRPGYDGSPPVRVRISR
jgi:hypothetical protein